MRLLLIEDENEASRLLCQALSGYGHVLDRVGRDVDIPRFLATEGFDLLLFGAAARGSENLEAVRRLRRHGWSIPLIVMLEDAGTGARIQALEAGADDIVCKPLVFAEVNAHIKALMRRARSDGMQQVRCGSLTYHTVERLFSVDGVPLYLTPREHVVLEALVAQPGRAVRKQAIYNKVYNLESVASTDAIEVYVHRLRRRLAGCGVSIVNVRGCGYRIEASKNQPHARVARALASR